MKQIKGLIMTLFSTIFLSLCMISSACANSNIIEVDRLDESGKTGVGIWDINFWHMVSAPTFLGVGITYAFEDATIETNIISDNTTLVILYESDVLNEWQDLSDYEYYYGRKKASRADCPLRSSQVASFQWATDSGWRNWENLDRAEQELSDYVTFIAQKDNNIVGYAVMYVYVSGLKGGGEVIVDKEFPQVKGKYQKVSEKSVKERINEVIELHKALAD